MEYRVGGVFYFLPLLGFILFFSFFFSFLKPTHLINHLLVNDEDEIPFPSLPPHPPSLLTPPYLDLECMSPPPFPPPPQSPDKDYQGANCRNQSTVLNE